MQYLHYRNSLTVLLRDLPSSLLVRYLPFYGWRLIRSAIGRLLRYGDADPLRGYCAAIRRLPHIMVERRTLHRGSRLEWRRLDALIRRTEPLRGKAACR